MATDSYQHLSADRKRLIEDIVVAIEEYTHPTSHLRPPFSPTELLTIGAILSTSEHPTETEISHVITSQLSYYRTEFNASTWFHGPAFECSKNTPWRNCYCITYSISFCQLKVPGYSEGLQRHDLPLTLLDPLEQRFSIDLLAARIHLRGCLQPAKPNGRFCLLDLPAELRLAIFEYALQLPKIASGGGYEECNPRYLRVLSREHEPTPQLPIHQELATVDTYSTPPLNEVLALLLVSKEIHKEAVPVFYNINPLTLGKDSWLLERCGLRPMICPARLVYVKSLEIVYQHYKGSLYPNRYAEICFKYFQTAANLRHVRVYIFANNCLASSPLICGRPARSTAVSGLPGIEELCVLLASAQEYELRGECESIRSFIGVEVRRLKSAKKRTSGKQ